MTGQRTLRRDRPETRRRLAVRLAELEKASLLVSLAVLAVVAVIYSVALGSRIRFPDEADYLTIAHNLANHGTFSLDGSHPTAYRAPGYPIALAGLRLFSLPLVALRLLNFAAWAVVVWGGWQLARRIAGPVAATIAAPLIALYPLGIYTAGSFYPQVFGAAALLVALVLLAEIVGSRRPLLVAAASGLAFGLLIVTLPTFVYVLILGAVWLIAGHRAWAAGVLVVLAAVIPLSWTLRNAISLDSAVPVSTNSGLNLLLGYSEHAGIRTGASVDISTYSNVAVRRHLDEVQLDRFYRRSAVDWIEAHPGKATELFAGKNLDYFAPFDRLSTGGESSNAYNALAAVSYLPFLTLFLLRLAFWRRHPASSLEQFLIAVYLVGAPVAAVFFTRVRFRVPADPLLLVVAAGLLAVWLRGGMRRAVV